MNDDKKQLIFDLNQYMNKIIAVKLVGGKEIVGKLSGFDNICNLVLVSPKNQYSNDFDWKYGRHVVILGNSIISIVLGVPKILKDTKKSLV
ncbi:hypothetical protein EDEG_01552 [Edhazardia aedis USNM 41457]|uniref:Sm domain-containing protein n=1 Tax=Edhazardia aedis (strain USNM 41457) TaxID=1003232 RepID=J9DS81_EDHAE|nr:hypothetical protein EDEG_01552 [Edhazardia aedis USNM 41457]|eukprot:EJW04157.1 hypothetical protein EDEG_01552 [Edhazardia aedis USNM 41457]